MTIGQLAIHCMAWAQYFLADKDNKPWEVTKWTCKPVEYPLSVATVLGIINDGLHAMRSKLEEIDESFRREDEKLYSLVKQASLELGNFGMVKEAMIQADHEGISKILVNVYETRLKKEAAARVNFEDTITRGTLNTDHPIVKSLQKLAIFKEEYIEVKNQKDELEKAAMGGMTKFKLFLAGLATLGADTIKKAHDANNITNAKAKNYYNRAVSLRPI